MEWLSDHFLLSAKTFASIEKHSIGKMTPQSAEAAGARVPQSQQSLQEEPLASLVPTMEQGLSITPDIQRRSFG
eukprot:879876-Amphidinium_carterae.1